MDIDFDTYIISNVLFLLFGFKGHLKCYLHTRCDISLDRIDVKVRSKFLDVPTESEENKYFVFYNMKVDSLRQT
jgi:hypothetical protein